MLVFATDDLVEAWARAPIRLGPANSFRALVVGRRDIPAITEESYARAFPSLAILSAFARARDDDAVEVSRAAMSALEALHPDRRGVYYDLILDALDRAAAQALEEWMDFKNYEFKSDFAKRNFAQGKAEGKTEGELLGAREALYDVLAARRFEVDAATRARIDACRYVATLRSWIARAAVAQSMSEVIE